MGDAACYHEREHGMRTGPHGNVNRKHSSGYGGQYVYPANFRQTVRRSVQKGRHHSTIPPSDGSVKAGEAPEAKFCSLQVQMATCFRLQKCHGALSTEFIDQSFHQG